MHHHHLVLISPQSGKKSASCLGSAAARAEEGALSIESIGKHTPLITLGQQSSGQSPSDPSGVLYRCMNLLFQSMEKESMW